MSIATSKWPKCRLQKNTIVSFGQTVDDLDSGQLLQSNLLIVPWVTRLNDLLLNQMTSGNKYVKMLWICHYLNVIFGPLNLKSLMLVDASSY